MNTVIFISNPFGYGPTGKIIVLMEELSQKWDGNIVFAGSKKCQEIIPESLKEKIKILTINERKENAIKTVLSKYVNPLVVVCLNRIAIETAKKMKLHSFFIDSLTWLWDRIPIEYLKADTYYYYNIFNAEKKVLNLSNIKPISPIIGSVPKYNIHQNKKYITIHLGGFSNPFTTKTMTSYLDIIIYSLKNVISYSKKNNKILKVVGGSNAISYLKKHIILTKNIELCTLGRNDFLDLLTKSEKLLTTPGSTSTFEAFTIGVPTAFLLPTNLSQWQQLNEYKKYNAAKYYIDWEYIIDYNWNFKKMNEKKAIKKFQQLSNTILVSPILFKKTTEKIEELIKNKILTSNQKSFIQKIGVNGSSTVISDILKVLKD